MGDDIWHWALCDTDSQKEGKVTCAYMVLLADYPNGVDGRPVGEQFMPKRIVDALNTLPRLESENRALLAAHSADKERIEKLEALLRGCHVYISLVKAQSRTCELRQKVQILDQIEALLTPPQSTP
jgi:hypothetical protein